MSQTTEPERASPPARATSPAQTPDGNRTDGQTATARQPSSPGPQQAAGKIQVPERPELAPGVRLAGQMHESAFKDPPWLIEREDAGYVQVTELLYRIAERCDGRRTLAEIAADVSEVTGRSVSADNVKQLVAAQLLLKGLVKAADGRVVGAGDGSRSLLALNAKMKMVGPSLLEPLTRAFGWLFWPPILIVALLTSALAQG